MTGNATDAMNLIIARFMGMEGTAQFIVANYRYQLSWELLMQVWFKCQHLGADMGPRFKKYYDEFHAGIDYQSIKKCHRTCYDFIVWYNRML